MIDPIFTVHDYVIGGKMVVGKATISEQFKELIQDGDARAKKELKITLIHQMAEFMLENKLVEFTYYDDHITGGRNVAVRAYLAPNDQVKILRLANKIV
jgi:hypothetical protein